MPDAWRREKLDLKKSYRKRTKKLLIKVDKVSLVALDNEGLELVLSNSKKRKSNLKVWYSLQLRKGLQDA